MSRPLAHHLPSLGLPSPALLSRDEGAVAFHTLLLDPPFSFPSADADALTPSLFASLGSRAMAAGRRESRRLLRDLLRAEVGESWAEPPRVKAVWLLLEAFGDASRAAGNDPGWAWEEHRAAAAAAAAAAEKAAAARAAPPFRVRVELESPSTSFAIEVDPEWCPHGATRFRELVDQGVLAECRIWRAVPGFICQMGIPGDPAVAAAWRERRILDDARHEAMSNDRGTVTFATSGPGGRSSQFFINFEDNGFLDDQGFPPFGRIVAEDMGVLDAIFKGYVDGPPRYVITHISVYIQSMFSVKVLLH